MNFLVNFLVPQIKGANAAALLRKADALCVSPIKQTKHAFYKADEVCSSISTEITEAGLLASSLSCEEMFKGDASL
ncbi:MAG: hypothetical protein LBQ47_04330, partial [Endomicrobium sp.]|nr:hypothetical protein [Endomicrobium sp.]